MKYTQAQSLTAIAIIGVIFIAIVIASAIKERR